MGGEPGHRRHRAVRRQRASRGRHRGHRLLTLRKGAFAAGAFDQRIALTMPVESGSAGTGIFRWNGRNNGTGGAVTVRNTDWNGAVAPGATTTFGFTDTGSSSTAPHTLTCTGF